MRRQWGEDLITSWNSAGWIDLPQRVGAKIARLIGRAAGRGRRRRFDLGQPVQAARAPRSALRPDAPHRGLGARQFPDRPVHRAGPSATARRALELRLVEPTSSRRRWTSDTALLMLTHVDYRSGRMHDMARLTRGRARGRRADVVGPRAQRRRRAGRPRMRPARSRGRLRLQISQRRARARPRSCSSPSAGTSRPGSRSPAGWAMPRRSRSRPLPARRRHRALPVRHAVDPRLTALEAGVDLLLRGRPAGAAAEVDGARPTRFIELVEERCAGFGLALATPRDAAARGSQVRFAIAEGYPIVQALIARGVIGDFRAPDLLRFGFAPLYMRFVDVWDAVERCARCSDERSGISPCSDSGGGDMKRQMPSAARAGGQDRLRGPADLRRLPGARPAARRQQPLSDSHDELLFI